jgi:PAS domain S-box-containing protein
LLVEAVKDYAIFMLDPSGRVMTWNAGAQRIKGYEAREIIGHHFSEFYDPEEVRAGKCERELEGAARDGRFEDEGWRVRKDGTKFWANVVITALRSEIGELVGFAKVTRDLTDRRRLEQEQLRLARAEEAIRLRDEFLSLAAHELKTPLTVLQLQLDTLGDRTDESNQRVLTKLQRAAQSSERLANLVESLLDVSRIATGRFALALQEFDMSECVLRLCEGLQLPADKARCELTVDAPTSIVGMWDRLRIEQALTNLLANAIKYGAAKPVHVSVRQSGDDAILEVRDHGPGVPQTELARIFQRFERAASIRNYGGLGVGLYLIQAIVDAHGGAVTAENVPGGGARFRVTLPLRPSVALAGGLTASVDVN